jgi:1-acyl-sn-glycerol-3-phosphate acyltransferase
MSPFFYWLVTYAVRFFVMPLYATIDAKGLENIPRTGPLLIASNHLNDADPGVLATRFPRRIIFMTKAELFKVPVLSRFLKWYGAFPVRRGEADLSSLRRSNETLKAGLALVLFPEGTRSALRASLGQAWPGAGLIALRNDVPILPCAITGSQDMGMPGMFLRVFRRRHITLTVGKPFHLEQPARVNAETSKAGAEAVMRRIAELLPEGYRGYYGGSPPPTSPAVEQSGSRAEN